MKKFWIRTASSVIYVALFLGTMFSGIIFGDNTVGALVFVAFLLFVEVGCTREFYKIGKLKGARPLEWMGYLATVLVVLSFLDLGYMYSIGDHGVLNDTLDIAVIAVLILLLLGLQLTAIIQLWRKSDNPFGDIASTFVPAFYIGMPLGLMQMTQMTQPNLLFMVVALVWVNDACAYMSGSLIGKHKMWERLSPGKSWEGTVIGVLCAALVGGLATLLPMFGMLDWYCGVALGVLCGVIGTLGDLVESMYKRSAGLKDSGKFLPGHGGFLDRFDSLLILMPFAVILLYYFIGWCTPTPPPPLC